MEQIRDEIGVLVLPCLILWFLLRIFFGFFCSRIASRWFAHTLLVSYSSAALISISAIRVGFIDGKELFSVMPYTFVIALNIVVMPFLYGWDKRQSNYDDAGRIPEIVLHSLAIFGGGIGALLSQNLFRHKTKKKSFQRLRWIAVGTSMALYYIVLFNRIIE